MRIVKYFLSAMVGLTLYLVTLQRPYAIALASKAAGGNVPCPWGHLISLPFSEGRFVELQTGAGRLLRLQTIDANWEIERIQSDSRPFWIKMAGGKQTLAYAISEQQWIAESSPRLRVRDGDVVVDVGARVGIFADVALRRGAAKVILVEPDPVNAECIRRNFESEIHSGHVILIADAPVRSVDEILRRIGVERVDFIRIDAGGREREALRGASETLAKWKPRLMLGMHHRPDDQAVLRGLVLAANPKYREFCAVCSSLEESDSGVVPYAVFFE
jgi:uncharacterized small protein (DUF1192 family)